MSDQEIRNYLADHKVPQFIDQFVLSVIANPPDDWKQSMVNMVERQERAAGKGAKSAPAGNAEPEAATSLKFSYEDPFAGGDEAPAYCQKDPTIQPPERQIKPKTVHSPDIVTGSLMKKPQVMKDLCTTVSARFNHAANKCQSQCKVIQEKCNQEGKPFFDEKFWFGKRTTMYPKGSPPDCTVTEPHKVQRAAELYPGAPLFADGVAANDIVQGAIGDCFFVGAVSALASCKAEYLKPLERLFVFSDIKNGIYGVMFFKNGGWRWVIIDDYVAIQQSPQGDTWPQYAAPGSQPELWPMLIEKAYAKMHYCWDAIDGGWSRYALEDLTGGLAYTLDLHKKDKKQYGTFPSKFQELNDNPLVVLGCSVGWHVKDGGGGAAGRAGEEGTIGGLFKGHAYSVLTMHTCSDGQAFVRVRNPWGNDAEWKGAYSDGSPEWDQNPLYKRELNPEFKDDGAFWMKWEDFSIIFTDIDVARFFRYDDVVFTFYGAAPEKDFVERNVFILKVDQDCPEALFTVAQDDPLTSKQHSVRKNGKFKGMMLSVWELTEAPPKNFEDLQNYFGQKTQTEPVAGRTSSKQMNLKKGWYCVVPRFRNATGIGYYLRLTVPFTAQMSMYQWDEGPAEAQDTVTAQSNAQQVPAVGISALHPSEKGGASLGVQTSQKGEESGGLSQAVIEGLGIPNKRKFDKMVQKAFNGVDKGGRGALDKVQGKEAFKKFVSRQPKIAECFDQSYDKYGKGMVDPIEFKDIVNHTLLAMSGQ
uniref:Calpain catalytic domain-containing protein n=1 Tax=Eutreptiella gymnastica TaxID=73025 RepID=A0A7S4FWH8_9EUGL